MVKCVLKQVRYLTEEDTGIKITEKPEILDIRVWKVPISKEYPKGINYSLNYIKSRESSPVYGGELANQRFVSFSKQV